MEESEKRRERLRAMRMQADLTENSDNVGGSAMPDCLSNPLLEAPSTDASCTPPRFDYYTDPMAAFSANRKKGKPDRQMHHYSTPPNFSHSPRAPVSSPSIGFMSPQVIPSPAQMFQAPPRNPVWGGSGGSVGYNSPSIASPTGSFPSPAFNSWSSPLNNARQNTMQWHGHSPSLFSGRGRSPNFGRGRGWHSDTANPYLGRGGERGQGSHGHSYGAGSPRGPSQFYKSSMVEDPWKFLKPVMWKGTGVCLKTPESSKSFGMKRPRTSDVPDKSSSEPSLAEYLAASFHETVSSEANEN